MELTLPSNQHLPRLLILGMDCHFTIQMIEYVIDAGLPIAGVFLPGVPGALRPISIQPRRVAIPLATTAGSGRDVRSIAHRNAIPVFRVGRTSSADTLSTIEALEPDILISICFPRLIPRRVRSLFPGRALNVHTSVLPDLRGPDPVFWTFRRGDGHAGVTIHHLTGELDAGPIVVQERVKYVDGTTESELEASLALTATVLLTDLHDRTPQGSDWPRIAQDANAATWAPVPSQADFMLESSMTARAAYNFVRGIGERGVPVTVEHHDAIWVVSDVIAYSSGHPATMPDGATQAVPFLDGYLLAKLEPRP